MNTATANAEPSQLARGCLSFVRSLSLGDLESATACFAKDGCLITPDATAIHGRNRIRPVLAQLIARHTEIEVELSNPIGTGDVVLVRERWKIRSGSAEGPQIEQTLNPTMVLRLIESEWKLAIAAPWAGGMGRP